MYRPLGITILGILHLIGGVGSIIIAVIGVAILGVGAGMGYYMGMFSAVLGSVFLIIFGILAAIEFVIAIALFSGKNWGRIVVITLSIIGLMVSLVSLMGNPYSVLNMILGVIVLWYMWRPHVIDYFDGTRHSNYLDSSTLEQKKNVPLDILKERYAKGELTKEEFDKMKEDLSD